MPSSRTLFAPPASRRSPRLAFPQRTDTLIEREPRGTEEYERKFASLSEDHRRTVALAEESVLADRGRTHARRMLADGTIVDLTAYDEFDVGLTLRELDDGLPQFIDMVVFEPS